MRRIILINFALLLLTAGMANGRTITVRLDGSGDYTTIQDAIDDSNDGDIIEVADGTYTGPGNRDISFRGKAITVRSQNGPENCIIDCENSGRGFYFYLSESNDSVLEGFTIMNGLINQQGRWAYGAGIYCKKSSPTIKNCVITGCQTNGQWAYGGGIYCGYGNAIIANCIITKNSCKGTWAKGGGIYTEGGVTIVNCVVSGNSASSDYWVAWANGGGIYCKSGIPKITNSIFWGNSARVGTEIYGGANVTYSDVRGDYWGEGNISVNPRLTPDGHLQAGSPCIDSGDPDFLPEPGQVDIDGQPRVMGGRVDMGVDEVTAPLISTIVLSSKEFDFDVNEGGHNPEPQILSIRNILEDTLSWEVTEDCPWLEVYPHTGISTYEPNYVTLSVDITGLVGGIYNCILTISSPNASNSPRTVAVNLVVHGPIIAVSTEKVEFEGILGEPNPPDQTLEIRNIGGAILNWAITYDDCNWLEITPISGSSTGEVDEVNLGVGIAAPPVGVYNCTLSVIDPNAENSPQTVTVTLHVYTDLLHVPSQVPTIQDAIDHVLEGGTVIVADGMYIGSGNKNVDFRGKAITVRSESGPENCIIDCENSGRGFRFRRGEDENSVLDGFTITNAYEGEGGGILCFFSNPTITNCIITDNSAWWDGGGIFCEFSSPAITNCKITGNTAREGGGISCWESNPTITNCTISGNTANLGGGIFCGEDGSITVTDCTITGNSAKSDGGAIYYSHYSNSLKITNSTITGNSAEDHGGGIFCGGGSSMFNSIVCWGNADSSGQGQPAQIYGGTPGVWFSCIQDDNPDDANVPFGTENFNIDDDPCFVEPGYWDANGLWLDGDYHLLADSPCIETGNPYFTYQPGDVDMDGQPRLMGLRVDMGADEFEIAVIVVTKPQSGEVWTSGSTHEIEWSSYGAGAVDILFSTDTGGNWQTIEAGVTDTGSYMWHLPRKVDSNQCLVSVVPSVPDANVICIESGLFTIRPKFRPHKKVTRKWKSLGGDFDRSGLSQDHGPEFGCVKWKFQTNGPVTASVTITGKDKHRHKHEGKHEGKGKGKHKGKGKGKGKHKDASSDDYRVHIACEDGKLYTLDANGALLWSYDTNTPLLSSPTIGRDGTVYVGGQNGKLYTVDFNGNLRWTQSTGGFIYSSPALSGKDKVYACSQDGILYALRRDGSELWSLQTKGPGVVSNGSIFASPAIGANGTVYIGGLYDPNLYALDPKNGSLKWACNFASQGWPFASPVVAPDGTIYQTLLYDPNMYAIEPDSGTIIWSTDLADPCSGWFEPYYYSQYGYDYVGYHTSDSGWSEPTLGPDGTIYISFDDPYLRAVDPDGSINWVTKLGTVGGFTLTVSSDGLIYAASDDGRLYVVNPDGEEIARFESNDWLSFPVIAPDKTIIVSDANNMVWAITQEDCKDEPLVLDMPEEP